jgi:hypothetical protein
MNRYRVYCGPTLVTALAQSLRQNNVEVTCEGTEFVYVTTDCTAEELVRLLNTVMSGFTWRDVHCLNGSV